MLKTKRSPDEPSFREWLTWVFDHPDEGPEWHWDLDAPDLEPELTPPTIVAYLTDLFRGAPSHLAPYSLEQAKRGLWFLADNSCSSHVFALGDVAVDAESRLRCIGSMTALFRDYFAPRCADALSHRDEAAANPLNMICYMWWDVLPWWWHDTPTLAAESIDACLAVMAEMLEIESVAVRESALHGLGHFVAVSPGAEARVPQIIDSFLGGNRSLRPELHAYARAARGGCVL